MEILTVNEVAKRLGCSRQNVHQLLKTRKVQILRHGKMLAIQADDVKKLRPRKKVVHETP